MTSEQYNTNSEALKNLEASREEKLTQIEANKISLRNTEEKLFAQLYDSLRFYLVTPYFYPHQTNSPALLEAELKSLPDAITKSNGIYTSTYQAILDELNQVKAIFNAVVYEEYGLESLTTKDADNNPIPGFLGPDGVVQKLLAWHTNFEIWVNGITNYAPADLKVRMKSHVLKAVLHPLPTGEEFPAGEEHQVLLAQFISIINSNASFQTEISGLDSQILALQDSINAFLFSNIKSAFPILLFPMRLETRFVVARAGEASYELWVRLFPDVAAIDSHRENLTQDEITDGQIFWLTALKPENTVNGSINFLPGWRLLVAAHGVPRATWIVKSLEPTNLSTIQAELGQGNPISDLVFPVITGSGTSWDQPARTYVMPEQFVASLYSSYPATKPTLQKYSRAISQPLQVGINPQAALSDDPNVNFFDDQDINWVADFNKAEEVGMGIRFNLTREQYEQGFARLTVVGVKFGGNSQDPELLDNYGKGLLEDLFNHHHYTSGLRIITQGTPTNNTRDTASGYSEAHQQDASASLALELGEPLIPSSAPTEEAEKPAGQILAEALGINITTFEHIGNTDSQDRKEAISMNSCLWNATMGYYLENLLYPTITLEELDSTRDFFNTYVSGRGPIPAFAIGNQPYGILPTTRFSKWQTGLLDTTFDYKLNNLLQELTGEWQDVADKSEADLNTQYAADGDLAPLLHALGTDATSSEFYQRYGFGPHLGNNYLNQIADNGSNPLAGELIIRDFPVGNGIPRILESVFQPQFRKLAGTFSDLASQTTYPYGYLVDELAYSETRSLTPIAGDKNYIHWLAESTFNDIRTENFEALSLPETFVKPNSLLYYLLRHSLMLAYWEAAMRLMNKTAEARVEIETFNIFSTETETRWEALTKPNSAITGHPSQSLGDYLRTAADENSEDTKYLKGVLNNLFFIAELPTARLERLLTEHLDLCAYRLDAWRIAQVTKRLQASRNTAAATGIYLGGFGWLEEVRPEGQDTLKDRMDVVYTDARNLGYIHAPSINQATAAAILRNAYSTQTGGEKNYAINLTSGRVRQALSVLEGIREGQTLSAILGYQFERGLHDAYDPTSINLDQYIHPLRVKFPLSGSFNQVSGQAENPLQEAISARNVVDGLALLNQYKNDFDLNNYVDFGLPESITPAEKTAIIIELNKLGDTLDALGDLTVAESIYQTTLGKFDQANATLDSISKGKFPPAPEIVQTPRNEIALTQRVILNLNTGATGSWGHLNTGFSPKAAAEPLLNSWLVEVAQPLRTVQVEVTYGPDKDLIKILDFDELGLEPLDLMFLLNETSTAQESPLSAYIRFALVKNHKATEGDIAETSANLEIDYEYIGSGNDSFKKMLPFLLRIKELISNSRACKASDLSMPESQSPETSDPNLTAFASRFNLIKSRLEDLRDTLSNSTVGYSVLLDAIATSLHYNIPEAISPGIYEEQEARAISINLVQALNKKISEVEAVLEDIATNGLPADTAFEKYQSAINIIFGQDFKVLPVLNLTAENETTLTSAFSESPHLLTEAIKPPLDVETWKPMVMAEWLQGVAKVRERLHTLEQVTTLHEIYNLNTSTGIVPELALSPVQLPPQANDFWMGVEYPTNPAVFQPSGNKLSLVFLQLDTLSISGAKAGLLVDEWVETIPLEDVNTAVAFHYNQPKSQPPQTLLLAVSPEQATAEAPTWTWNNLLGCVNETLDFAKLRAVEPDHLANSYLAQVLPALIAPVSTRDTTITLDFAKITQEPLFRAIT